MYATIAPWCTTPLRSFPTAVPYVMKGVGQRWSASGVWTFEGLAALNPTLPVTLVQGNREREATAFVKSTFGEYLASLQQPASADEKPLYLKEFDLLKEFPQLARNLPYHTLFPDNTIKSHGAWIGPAGAKTGLHYDYLDNFAWLVAGKKRFYLAAPGSVESVEKLSRKYDRWAQLANMDVHELALLAPAHGMQVYVIDLEAGDCLFVPKGWWHQVENLSPSILLGGFFGPRHTVLGKWFWSLLRQGAHQLGIIGSGNCTCCHARA